MRVTKIIEARQWRNIATKQTASIYGAVPYTNEKDKANWIMENVGFTWVNSNGTIGLGRMPAKTMQEAIEVMERVNKL